MLHLVSAVWYERQRSRYANHWLLQLEQVADLTPLEQGCAGFHLNNGRGAPVVHLVPRLVRALLVRHLNNLSFRQTMPPSWAAPLRPPNLGRHWSRP